MNMPTQRRLLAMLLLASCTQLVGCGVFGPSTASVWPEGPVGNPPTPPSAAEEAMKVARRDDQVSLSVLRGQQLNGGIAVWFVIVVPDDLAEQERWHASWARAGFHLSSLDTSKLELIAPSGQQVVVRPRRSRVPIGTFVNPVPPAVSPVLRGDGAAIYTTFGTLRTDIPCPPGRYRVRLRGDWEPGTLSYRAESLVVDRDWREIVVDPMPDEDFRHKGAENH